jgi:hypothetical protein
MTAPSPCPICRAEPQEKVLTRDSVRFGCYLDKPFPHMVVCYAATSTEARERYALAFGVKP